jgi:diguanylate cyclase (GGDEF)-like protein
VVEDSRAIRALLSDRIVDEPDLEVLQAADFAAAREMLQSHRENILCAVVDLNLPDAPNGEVVDYMMDNGVSVLVLTGNVSEAVREKMIAKRVADYVVKHNASEIDYVIRSVVRLMRNTDTSVLVVDDSSSARTHLRQLLETQRYQVVEASNGLEALALLDDNPTVRVVVSDYNMPGMDGLELIYKMRRKHGRDDLIIIGMSGQNSGSLPARLLKAGANDFLNKPFLAEEFICRINQNIDLLGQIHTIRDAANRDYLTRLYNRRYFFETGKTLLANACRGNIQLALAMVDIDHFKRLNDTYGHDAGDYALLSVSRTLEQSFRQTDIVARFGGEEFCVLAVDRDGNTSTSAFERARRQVEALKLEWEGKSLQVTCSLGVCLTHRSNLHEMIRIADDALYQAKNSGRNRVVAT